MDKLEKEVDQMEDIITPVQEDSRLFVERDARAGCSGLRKIRMNVWHPFEERYWPFSAKGVTQIGDGICVVLLIREYDPQRGEFRHVLSPLRMRVSDEEHPSKTRAYVGFMLLGPGSAMATLMIPQDFGKNLV